MSDICVLGGCGAMGRVILDCLRRLDPCLSLSLADRQTPSFPLPCNARFVRVDLRQHALLTRVLRAHRVVINSTSHHFNLPVMRASLDAGVHYLDLGGLFHFTRRQLKLSNVFRHRGLTAILGMGCAPGISNLLTLWASEGMDAVESVHIKVGGKGWGTAPTDMPYAIGTIREELTLRPAIFEKGRWNYAPPRSGVEYFLFPPPVGRQKIFRTLHSEIATLPLSFPSVKSASFKIGFTDDLIHEVLTGRKQMIASISSSQKKFRDCETTLALVRGRQKGKRVARLSYCTVRSGEGRLAGDWDTAWPPAIVSRMLIKGEIQMRGVFPPEQIVPLKSFLAALRRVGFRLIRK